MISNLSCSKEYVYLLEYSDFVILPAHLAHKSVLSEPKTPKFSLRKGWLFIGIGALIIILGSLLFPRTPDPSFGLVLLPFTLYIIGAVFAFKGFTSSKMEKSVREFCDRGIKKVRDKWYKEAVQMFIGRKWRAYILSFFIPLIFLISVIVLLAKGVIMSTFFPDIPPDFFNV